MNLSNSTDLTPKILPGSINWMYPLITSISSNTAFPAYLNHSKTRKQSFSDKHILFSLPVDEPYTSHLYFNKTNLPVQSLATSLNKQETEERIIMAATYTSPFGLPVGLTVERGRLINPFLQPWDGLIWLEKGKLFLLSTRELNLKNKQLDIKNNYRDFKVLLDYLESHEASLIQSHLLVEKGQSVINLGASQKQMRRRALFQTLDGSLHVYDSMDENLSFQEVADKLVGTYQAEIAINLDMGGYNYYTHIQKNGQTKDYSDLFQGVKLSNLLVIDK